MPKQPTKLREWRISIMREKIQYLGRVVAPDKEAAIFLRREPSLTR
jgi:hypothetical protein